MIEVIWTMLRMSACRSEMVVIIGAKESSASSWSGGKRILVTCRRRSVLGDGGVGNSATYISILSQHASADRGMGRNALRPSDPLSEGVDLGSK